MIWTGRQENINWTGAILSELAQAKSYGNKAIVIVESYVFNNLAIDPNASANFGALVDQLIANGYLVPNNPAASTVLAFYPFDEPDIELKDVCVTLFSCAPHPALANAVNVIRSNPNTSNFPLAVIASHKYGDAIQGIRLFDWAGMDYYDMDTGSYISKFISFRDMLRPEQRTIMVPQAAIFSDDIWLHDPWHVFQHASDDNQVIMVMPFLWGHADMIGLRSIESFYPYDASLRGAYEQIGGVIKRGLSAQYVGMSVPSIMVSGRLYNVSVTFKNNGSGTWQPGTNIRLGSQNPADNTTWGVSRVALPTAVYPQQTVTFKFTVKAPSGGSHNFQWRMVADGLAWFGKPSANASIKVFTGSISASPNPCKIYSGQSTCSTSISWNSNRSDAEVWVSNTDGSNPQLFARAQSYTQVASWINTSTKRFTLKAAGTNIAYVDVRGELSSYTPPEEDSPTCPGCQIP